MDTALIFLILIGSLVVLMLLGIEVFVAVAVAASIGLVLFVGQDLRQFLYTAWDTSNSFDLTALPLFVFMGAVFSGSGIVGSLLRGAERWLGWLPGGTVMSVLGANAIFGALCGSSTAATAALGQTAYPEMEKQGYSPKVSLPSIAVGGVLSVAIPPSLTLVVYGTFAETSVAQLFAAVIVPGIILAFLFMIMMGTRVKLDPSLVPPARKYTWRDRFHGIVDLIPWLLSLGVILGVIFGGVMSPTEAAALGAFISVMLAIIYRRMSFDILKKSALSAVRITTMAIFLLFTAKVMGQVFAHVGLLDLFSNFLTGLDFGKYGTLAVIAVVYIIGGMFLHEWALMVVTLPFIVPLLTHFGLSLVWFGVWFVMIGETGLITPPFGMNLFALHAVVPKHDTMKIGISCIPFLVPMIFIGALITIFPDLALWLPDLLFSR